MSDEALQKLDVSKRLDEHEISRTHAAPLLSCWSDATGHIDDATGHIDDATGPST